MANVFVNHGDTVEFCIGGVWTKGRVELFSRTGDVIGHIRNITPMCAACNENEVDDPGDICAGCTMEAMQYVVIKSVLDYIGDSRPHLEYAVHHWAERDHDARMANIPYVDLESAGWDYMSSDTDAIGDITEMWANRIAEIIRAKTNIT